MQFRFLDKLGSDGHLFRTDTSTDVGCFFSIVLCHPPPLHYLLLLVVILDVVFVFTDNFEYGGRVTSAIPPSAHHLITFLVMNTVLLVRHHR